EPALQDARGAQSTAKDSLTELLQAGGNADYAVYSILAQSRSGKSFGLPNRASVPLVLTLRTPQSVKADLVPTGIRGSWYQAWPPKRESKLSVQYVWRVMRRQEGANDSVMVRQLNTGNEAIVLVDDSIQWEKTYQYWIVPVTLWQEGSRKGEVESEDSPVATVFSPDTFPPPSPSGVHAGLSTAPEHLPIYTTLTPHIDS